jgi:hypothetical protein
MGAGVWITLRTFIVKRKKTIETRVRNQVEKQEKKRK